MGWDSGAFPANETFYCESSGGSGKSPCTRSSNDCSESIRRYTRASTGGWVGVGLGGDTIRSLAKKVIAGLLPVVRPFSARE